MQQFLAHLRRANAVLAALLDRTIELLHVQRRAQTVAVVSVAALVTLMVGAMFLQFQRARDAWGATAQAVIASRLLETGEMLSADNTQLVDVPVGLIADDALESVPAGATVRIGVETNTLITASMVSGVDQSIEVPEGWRIVAMAIDVTAPTLVPGDTVDVVSTDSVLASGAIVIAPATDTQGPSIAVPQDAAAVVATAAREGTASLVLAG